MQFLNGSQKMAVNCNEQHLLVESVKQRCSCAPPKFSKTFWDVDEHAATVEIVGSSVCHAGQYHAQIGLSSWLSFKRCIEVKIFRGISFGSSNKRLIEHFCCAFSKMASSSQLLPKTSRTVSRKLKDCLWEK